MLLEHLCICGFQKWLFHVQFKIEDATKITKDLLLTVDEIHLGQRVARVDYVNNGENEFVG